MINFDNYNIVCSNSIDKILKDYTKNKRIIVGGKCTYEFYKSKCNTIENVCAIGGGSVIDKAKIISKGPIKIAIPTTASGSTQTCHSVVWNNLRKTSVERFKPERVVVLDAFLKNVPEEIQFYTKVDMISHIFDSQNIDILKKEKFKSKTYKEIVEWGIAAGNMIENTPTTILHGLSYYLTAHMNIGHGEALSYFLPTLFNYESIKLEDHFKTKQIVNFKHLELSQIDKSRFVNFILMNYIDKIRGYKKIKNHSVKEIENFIEGILNENSP